MLVLALFKTPFNALKRVMMQNLTLRYLSKHLTSLGSLRADAFRGPGFSLLEKIALRGLQTRAFPAGVTALHSPRLIRLFDLIQALSA